MSTRPLLPRWLFSRASRLIAPAPKLILSGTMIFATLILSIPPASASWQEFWNSIFQTEPPIPPRSGSGRGPAPFCQIAPQDDTTIWSDRPTLIWQGSLAKVELWQKEPSGDIRLDSYDRFDPIHTLIPEDLHQVTFHRPLPPGQYEWRINRPLTETATKIDFEIAAPPQAPGQPSTVKLRLRERKAIQQAQWLAQQQQWADFWQTLLGVKHPSDRLQVVLSNTVATVCPLLNETATLSVSPPTAIYQDYQITGKAGQTIEVNLHSPAFATRLTVSDAKGNNLMTAESDRTNDYQVIQQVTLPQEGEYQIRVAALTNTEGNFHLIVSSRFGVE